MFHLFNSLYVEVDREINERCNRAVISEQMGMPFLLPQYDPEIIDLALFASNLDQLGREAFEGLLDKFVVLEHAYIYVDEAAYIRLWAALVQAYCPNIDYTQFRYLFLLKKTILDCRTTTSMRERAGHINPVSITEPKVAAAFEFAKTDWVREVLVERILDTSLVRSVEWDILGVRLNNPMGTVPLRFRAMIDRVLLTNVPDIMGYLSTFMGDPNKWSFVGADMDTLLGEATIFQGCYGLNYLSNAEFVMLSSINGRYPIDWLVGMIKEMLTILRQNNDLSIVAYMESILEVYEAGFVIEDRAELLRLLHKFFDHGLCMVRVSQRDIGKYDDNLLRYAINAPLDVLERITEGATWVN